MTPTEAIAHDKLLQAFGDRPFRREEALGVVGAEHLSALITAGMIDPLEFRLKYAREFLELEAELQAVTAKGEQAGSPALASVKVALQRFPLLRHGREMLELCAGN